jgi:hypothetical protein
MATLINEIDPITFELQTYSSQDVSAMSSEVVNPIFDPSKGDYVEYTIISSDNSFQITDQNLEKVVVTNVDANTGVVFNIDLNPEKDLRDKGFTNGEYNVVYNFLRNQLSSSSDNRPFFIKEISPDRTELRLASNIISNDNLVILANQFKTQLNSSEYFQDFYLNFGSNNLIIANNILLDNTKTKYEILINLYESLPTRFRLKDVLWIVTQTADSLAFNIQFQPEVITPIITNPTLKSPNFDLPIKNRTNNSTNYINYEQLLNTNLVSSYDQILSYLEDKSISIGVDYTDFSNFVHFSSAESRIQNFYSKVQLLEQYSASLASVNATDSVITSSTVILQDKISNIIKNFDGFEYYLYYSSGSNTYPKNTSVPPYLLLPTSSGVVQTWLTSSINSASIYDVTNKDYLINTIPTYLTDDPQNDPYKVFINMMGQFYDNIWIYYKDVSNRYSGDNRLEYGISKDLVADAIRSFGLKIYQNNFSVSDLFEAFTGFNSGSITRTVNNAFPTPPDTERITVYQTASQESLYTPLDDVNKEMYKRIYHNLPYLLKSKGTVAGLQNIISMFGITSSILSVREFGGEWNGAKPVTGIQDIVPDNIQILTNAQMSASFPPIIPPNTLDANYAFIPQFVLSSQKSILENYDNNRSLSPSVNTVEISFSPQNDIDNFIKDPSNLPNFDIGTYIGNPSQTFLPYYPDLQDEALSILSGNNNLNAIAYIRLIKYFDNSLFNMIKDFVPARTNLKSGITIKPHLLNRNKIVQPQGSITSSIYTGSIDIAFIEGGTGGTFDDYNSLTPRLNNTQSWYETIITPTGVTQSLHKDQAEFYNGELPYYPLEAFTADGDLNIANVYKYPSVIDIQYDTQLYSNAIPSNTNYNDFINDNYPIVGQINYYAQYEFDIKLNIPVLYIKAIKINSFDLNGNDYSTTLNSLTNITIPIPSLPGTLDTRTIPVGTTTYQGSNVYLAYPSTVVYLPIINSSYWNQTGPVSFIPDPPNNTIPNSNIIWDYYEYNPIINNTVDDVKSVVIMKVDLDEGITVPSNFDALINKTAARASVQDSNYSSYAWSNIRYRGSRASSKNFNISF